MKKAIFATCILFASLAGKSQNKDLKFGGGIDIGIPVSNLSGTSLGAGVDLLAHYSLSNQAAITGDIGYMALFAKSGGSTSNLIPLRAGLRFYPSKEFYLAGKIGVGFISNSSSYTTSVTSTAYSIGAGYMMGAKSEIGASYDGYSKNGTIGLINLRVGFFF
jgi:hypothetical protein